MKTSQDLINEMMRACYDSAENHETQMLETDFYSKSVQIGDEVLIRAKVIMGPPTWLRGSGVSVLCKILDGGSEREIMVPITAILIAPKEMNDAP